MSSVFHSPVTLLLPPVPLIFFLVATWILHLVLLIMQLVAPLPWMLYVSPRGLHLVGVVLCPHQASMSPRLVGLVLCPYPASSPLVGVVLYPHPALWMLLLRAGVVLCPRQDRSTTQGLLLRAALGRGLRHRHRHLVQWSPPGLSSLFGSTAGASRLVCPSLLLGLHLRQHLQQHLLRPLLQHRPVR